MRPVPAPRRGSPDPRPAGRSRSARRRSWAADNDGHGAAGDRHGIRHAPELLEPALVVGHWQVEPDGDGVVDDEEFVIEISRNYYAQTEQGTVCYFGEDVDIFNEDGTLTHEGAWRADDPGNAPGIFMPAEPEVGMTFAQESAPGIAEDEATILRSGRTVTVPAGTFTDTITVRDLNPLDGGKGTKVYARGVGLIEDGPLQLVCVTE